MQLELNKYYQAKNKRIQKITLFQKHKKFPFSDNSGNTYQSNGKNSWLNESGMDLFQEVKPIYPK